MSCSSNFVASLIAGLRPFKVVYWERVLKNFIRIKYLPHHLARRALTEATKLGSRCNYNRMVNKIANEIMWDNDPDTLTMCLDRYCAEMVNEERQRLIESCS